MNAKPPMGPATSLARVGSETQPTFRPFNPDGPLKIYFRHLPHWRQPGATYFVTFRLQDSIPASVVAEWNDLKARWYRAHGLESSWLQSDPDRFSTAYRAIAQGVRHAFEREQSRMLHKELDRCHGSCVLRHSDLQQIVAESLLFFHGHRLWLGDSVVMPNHVHLIVQPFDGWELEDLLGSIKKWTSRRIRQGFESHPEQLVKHESAGHQPGFWQQESFDRIIRDDEEHAKFRSYIKNNPQAAECRPGQFLLQIRDW